MRRRPQRWMTLLVVYLLGPLRLSAADAEVSGVFKGNDQMAKLAFVSAEKASPIAGKETIKLIFTEKDHSKDSAAALKALFGDYGSALVVEIQPDGTVMTCDIRHEAHRQKPITSPPSVKINASNN